MIDRKHIGLTTEPHSVAVEKGRLRFFAMATGQTDPIYIDEDAAKAAGYDSLPVPPTFYFSLDLERADPFATISAMEIDLGRILHGDQTFTYHKPSVAGDVITFQTKVVDIFDKKGGALEFVIQDTKATNQNGELVAEMRGTLVVRN